MLDFLHRAAFVYLIPSFSLEKLFYNRSYVHTDYISYQVATGNCQIVQLNSNTGMINTILSFFNTNNFPMDYNYICAIDDATTTDRL